jgi:dihydrofolate reductase
MIRLISAIDRKNGIAKHGNMPWNIPEDEAYFTNQTKKFGGNVLSGGATFRLSYKSHPLKDRHNFILTREIKLPSIVTIVNDLTKFLGNLNEMDLWVAGGATVYDQLISQGMADELYLTQIDADFGCDKFFPKFENNYSLSQITDRKEQNGFYFSYAVYTKKTS